MDNNIIPITKDINWVGVNDYETHLFEAIWPLPEGVSYNSYLIEDEKVALIDAVKHTTGHELLEKLKQKLNGRTIDYMVVNHMEPDHSGAISMLAAIYPEMKIVGNKKTIELVQDYYGITDNVVEVGEGEAINLGKHELQFFRIPMVHWPETMVTYEKTHKIVFSGDAFGGFGALKGGIFDDEVDLDYYENEIRRYFSNIVGKYSKQTQKALAKLSGLDIKVIAPTHGPVFRSNPAYIIDKYDKWSKHEVEEGVVIAFASMYGNTQKMAENIARGVSEGGVKNIRMYNVSYKHPSYIINEIWKFKGLILGSCTYNTRIFPHMEMLTTMLENKQLINRNIGIFGSFTWSGGAFKGLKDFAESSKLEYIEPSVEVKGNPTEEDIQACYELGKKMAQSVRD
jgi:flavorubredoxin